MADDDTMPDDTLLGGVASGGAPDVGRGECPICGSEFDDPNTFREHLGEVHDLYDEEGATTTTLWIPTFAVDPAPDDEPTIPEEPVPSSPVSAAREKAPVGLIVLVVLLIVFGGGLVAYIQSDGGSQTAADSPLVSTGRNPGSATSSGVGGTTDTTGGSDSTSSPTAGSSGGSTTGEQPTSASGGPSGTVPVTEPAPPGSSTTVTTAPPATFVAPTTSGARIENCSRDHGQRVVTYSWRYVGGTNWAPLAAYTAVGGGRYQHTVTVPSNGHTPITTVGVVDTNGTRYDVALSPTLSATNC